MFSNVFNNCSFIHRESAAELLLFGDTIGRNGKTRDMTCMTSTNSYFSSKYFDYVVVVPVVVFRILLSDNDMSIFPYDHRRNYCASSASF